MSLIALAISRCTSPVLILIALTALCLAGCGRSDPDKTAESVNQAPDSGSATLLAGQITPTAEERFLASRPGVFGPPPTAEQLARERVEGEQRRKRILARLDELKRLPPSAFPDLPPAIAAELNRRGCLIPQAYRPEPNNVIHGEFARPGQQDWALLCSIRDPNAADVGQAYTTHLLVFWNGSPEEPAEVDSFRDASYLDTADPEHPDNPNPPIYTGRSLYVATRDYILEHINRYADVPDVIIPDPLDHQGINDGLWDKASEVHYFHQGKWVKLPGAD